MSAYSLYYLPTVYFDGGDTVKVGGVGGASSLYGIIESCGAREVPKLDLSVELEAMGDTEFRAIYTLTNLHYPSDPPSDPVAPDGDDVGATGIDYSFSTVSTDPEGDNVSYRFDFGDGTVTDWLGPFASGDSCAASHSYNTVGTFDVIAQARDEWEFKTEWSPVSQIQMYDYLVGDPNNNKVINILDIVYLIDFLYKQGPPPNPLASGDPNATTTINILDIVYLIDFLYKEGPTPVYP